MRHKTIVFICSMLWCANVFAEVPTWDMPDSISKIEIEHFNEEENPRARVTRVMIYAIENNFIESVRFLIGNGADVNQCAGGGSPLTSAALGHLDIVKLLIEKGANVNLRAIRGGTALMCAVQGHLDIVRLLIENGADVNVHDQEGLTPLMFATFFYPGRRFDSEIDRNTYIDDQAAIIQLLIDRGADVNPRGRNGKSVIDYVYEMTKSDDGERVLAGKRFHEILSRIEATEEMTKSRPTM